MKRPETTLDLFWRSGKKRYRAFTRYRGVALVLLVPILLILSVYSLLPHRYPDDPNHTLKQLQNHDSGTRYAVVFDAGSTGSRVHVFRFQLENGSLKLQEDTFEQLKPGLSAYADNPQQAAESLLPLLETAMKTVPKKLQSITPVSLKATAGLRLLPGDKSEKILDAVITLLKTYPFKMAKDAVAIMDGKDEGAFAWLTLNYLLGKLQDGPEHTVSAIDLGGGSVQEAFALSKSEASAAPKGMITKLKSGDNTYHVYVHSYLGYGLMAARAKVLASMIDESGHPCYLKGSVQAYTYAGTNYPIKPAGNGAEFKKCADVAVTAMQVKESCNAPEVQCTFNGVWHGERPEGSVYYASSYLWDRALDSGIIHDEAAITWQVKPAEFATKAIDVCSKKHVDDVTAAYPRVKADAAPFLCADLTFCTQLLTAGFKLSVSKQITLVKQIEYNGQHIEAAWPLGAAINDLSSV